MGNSAPAFCSRGSEAETHQICQGSHEPRHRRRSSRGCAKRPKGILKRKKTLREAATRDGVGWGLLTWLIRARRRVTFRRTANLLEFSRTLDGGGTIPGDGTVLTLGLGKLLRTRRAPLLNRKSSDLRRPIEERAWVSPARRAKLLRASMGDSRFFAAWVRGYRREAVQIRASRKECNSHDKDRLLMPVSFEDARERALELSKEVRFEHKITVQESAREVSAPHGHRKRTLRSAPPVAGPKKPRTAVSQGSGLKCHRCSLPITGHSSSECCQCLVQAVTLPHVIA